MTSNIVTFEARLYARELGVEIISDPEWEEFARIVAEKKDNNPNPRRGLFGMMIAAVIGTKAYLQKVEPDEEKNKNKQELRQQIISEYDEATECVKEAAYLHQKAAQYEERALELQKRNALRSLFYG